MESRIDLYKEAIKSFSESHYTLSCENLREAFDLINPHTLTGYESDALYPFLDEIVLAGQLLNDLGPTINLLKMMLKHRSAA